MTRLWTLLKIRFGKTLFFFLPCSEPGRLARPSKIKNRQRTHDMFLGWHLGRTYRRRKEASTSRSSNWYSCEGLGGISKVRQHRDPRNEGQRSNTDCKGDAEERGMVARSHVVEPQSLVTHMSERFLKTFAFGEIGRARRLARWASASKNAPRSCLRISALCSPPCSRGVVME